MKTIELIDKYEIRQSKDGDYDPPSYKWVDNTGEIIRCSDCKYYSGKWCKRSVNDLDHFIVSNDDYCSRAKRKEDGTDI